MLIKLVFPRHNVIVNKLQDKTMPPVKAKLPYRKPKLSRDYWVKDHVFENIDEIRARCLAREDWTLGFPYRQEMWPGMRCPGGLLPEEMEKLEAYVMKKTGAKRLWQEVVADGGSLSHNYVQVVGENESGSRPHSDSFRFCRYAGVVYLTPNAPRNAGTSFYRFRHPDGTLDGNMCPPECKNLTEALGVTKLPMEAWKEELALENIYNRFVFYQANFVHSATNYFGTELENKRMTIVFFWMAEL
jgi:hypothetical protein